MLFKTGKLARNFVLVVGNDLAYVTNGDDTDNLRLRRLIILWVSLDLGIAGQFLEAFGFYAGQAYGW